MQKDSQIDFGKLLGFDVVADKISDGVDFDNETVGSRVGAKIGPPEPTAPTTKLDCSKLFGFETVASEVSEGIDFQNETIGDKLGAKVGVEPVESDARLKRDITEIARRGDGLPIYAFRYLRDDQVYVGVMAQDLLRDVRWRPAVTQKANGYLAVNYPMLGLRMAKLDEWEAGGMASLNLRGLVDNRH